MILILSGPVRSGKTTTLLHWTAHRDDCGGVLSPDVDGRRCLFNVNTKTRIPWQKEKLDSDADQQVGRFIFDGWPFQQACEWLDRHLDNPDIRYLILDEVGPLELSGKGWNAWLKKTIPVIGEKTLVLVVRESLVEEVTDAYALHGVEIVPKAYFAGAG